MVVAGICRIHFFIICIPLMSFLHSWVQSHSPVGEIMMQMSIHSNIHAVLDSSLLIHSLQYVQYVHIHCIVIYHLSLLTQFIQSFKSFKSCIASVPRYRKQAPCVTASTWPFVCYHRGPNVQELWHQKKRSHIPLYLPYNKTLLLILYVHYIIVWLVCMVC